ncbi:MAG: hypothetical protein ACD_46C00507G0001 [uncultured bacterium]|nr:MAG: hypothetical protein ACD_46C00507G0001 [uncultured bacterium]
MKKENIIELDDYRHERESESPAPISEELETAIRDLIDQLKTNDMGLTKPKK